MRRLIFLLAAMLVCGASGLDAQEEGRQGYLGFDRNDYPGDEAMREPVIANTGASIIKRELTLRLTEQSLMIADELFYLSENFSRPEKI